MILLQKKNYLLLISIFLIFIAGFYLRSYYEINYFISGSPYEIYPASSNLSNANAESFDFKDKAGRYPISFIFNNLFSENVFTLYALFFAVIFYAGFLFTNSLWGGFLSSSVFAIGSENLIQYTKGFSASGLSYLFIILAVLSLYLFLKKEKSRYLAFYVLWAILNSMTYHTGATAFFIITVPVLISALFYFKKENKKTKSIYLSLLISVLFYIFWIFVFDKNQLELIFKFFTVKNIFAGSILIVLCLLIYKKTVKDFVEKHVFKISLLLLTIAVILFCSLFFDILSLPSYYYISKTTLLGYFLIFLITHIPVLFFLKQIVYSFEEKRDVIFIGWFFGLVILFLVFMAEGYYARILDYSTIFAAVIFSIYFLNKDFKYKNKVIFILLFGLFVSHLFIFNDPFSKRRYYTEEEVISSGKIASLNLKGKVYSDLRTASLMKYSGFKNIDFGKSNDEIHNILFYEHEKIKNTNIEYVILSDSMKDILYSQDFPTQPIDQKAFDYYSQNFKFVDYIKPFYIYSIEL